MSKVKINEEIMDSEFVIANAIMERKDRYSLQDIAETNELTKSYSIGIIKKELKNLINLGIVYQDGKKYATRHRRIRWGNTLRGEV